MSRVKNKDKHKHVNIAKTNVCINNHLDLERVSMTLRDPKSPAVHQKLRECVFQCHPHELSTQWFYEVLH